MALEELDKARRGGDASEQTASTAAHHHDVHVRLIFEDFKTTAGMATDDIDIIKGVN